MISQWFTQFCSGICGLSAVGAAQKVSLHLVKLVLRLKSFESACSAFWLQQRMLAPWRHVGTSSLTPRVASPMHAPTVSSPNPRRLLRRPLQHQPAPACSAGQGSKPSRTALQQLAVSRAEPGQPPEPILGPGLFRQPSRTDENELLWAGYSDLQEQLRQMHKTHLSLSAHIDHLNSQIKNLREEQQQQRLPNAHAAWSSASFLMMFLFLINFAAFLVNLQASFQFPFWMGKAQATGALWVKPLLDFVLPVTNSSVILIFCVQAVKAAWNCLRW